jgi:SSS family solute:Na+ symporter
LITGGLISIAGIIIRQNDPEFFINEQEFWGIAMALSSLVYIAVSLFGKRSVFDMDKMLHRGKYAITGEVKVVEEVPVKGWKMLGMGKEFTRGDKVIYLTAYAWTAVWSIAFIVGTYFNLTGEVSDASWMSFWRIFIIVNITASVIILVWFSIGGFRDLKEMLKRLRTMKRDFHDDGFVVKNIN